MQFPEDMDNLLLDIRTHAENTLARHSSASEAGQLAAAVQEMDQRLRTGERRPPIGWDVHSNGVSQGGTPFHRCCVMANNIRSYIGTAPTPEDGYDALIPARDIRSIIAGEAAGLTAPDMQMIWPTMTDVGKVAEKRDAPADARAATDGEWTRVGWTAEGGTQYQEFRRGDKPFANFRGPVSVEFALDGPASPSLLAAFGVKSEPRTLAQAIEALKDPSSKKLLEEDRINLVSFFELVGQPLGIHEEKIRSAPEMGRISTPEFESEAEKVISRIRPIKPQMVASVGFDDVVILLRYIDALRNRYVPRSYWERLGKQAGSLGLDTYDHMLRVLVEGMDCYEPSADDALGYQQVAQKLAKGLRTIWFNLPDGMKSAYMPAAEGERWFDAMRDFEVLEGGKNWVAKAILFDEEQAARAGTRGTSGTEPTYSMPVVSDIDPEPAWRELCMGAAAAMRQAGEVIPVHSSGPGREVGLWMNRYADAIRVAARREGQLIRAQWPAAESDQPASGGSRGNGLGPEIEVRRLS